MDDVAQELVRAVPGSIFVRPKADGVLVICAEPKRVLAMLKAAVAELTTPSGETLQ
jgi:hypothetical protein